MNWSKALISGVAGGVVLAVYEAIMYGFVMAGTFAAYPGVFRQDANPIWFSVIAILIGAVAGMFFAKSRASWSPGPKGGMNFGMWLGLIAFFAGFYTTLMHPGFPYFLTWCMGGISLIGWVLYGAVAGAINKG